MMLGRGNKLKNKINSNGMNTKMELTMIKLKEKSFIKPKNQEIYNLN
jgi:hypothetical protein